MARASQSVQTIFDRKKRRVVGEMLTPGELRTTNAWLAIHGSSKEQLLTYESSGFVMTVVGSGSIGQESHPAREAASLGAYVARQGGIVMSGGRAGGIMAAVAGGVGDGYAGIVFPELVKEKFAHGRTIIVNSPAPRVELLATCAPVIVIFRGGLGTLMVLMRAIVHLRNRVYHPEQLPQVVFVNNYWIGLLTTMMNMGCLPKEFLSELKFFDRTEQIVNQLRPLQTLLRNQ